MVHHLNPKNILIDELIFFRNLKKPSDILTYWHMDCGEIIGPILPKEGNPKTTRKYYTQAYAE